MNIEYWIVNTIEITSKYYYYLLKIIKILLNFLLQRNTFQICRSVSASRIWNKEKLFVSFSISNWAGCYIHLGLQRVLLQKRCIFLFDKSRETVLKKIRTNSLGIRKMDEKVYEALLKGSKWRYVRFRVENTLCCIALQTPFKGKSGKFRNRLFLYVQIIVNFCLYFFIYNIIFHNYSKNIYL